MELKLKKLFMASFHPCKVFVNEQILQLDNNLASDLNSNQKNEIYVKSYWFKSNKVMLENDHKSCIATIDLIIGLKTWISVLAVFFGLLLLNYYLCNELISKVITLFGIFWIIFQIYIYTLGRKKYLKLKVEYID